MKMDIIIHVAKSVPVPNKGVPLTPTPDPELEAWCAKMRALGEQARVNHGFLPLPAFLAVSDALVTVPVEVLAISRRGTVLFQEPTILFTPRPKSDPFFAGMMHTPGGMVRPGVPHREVLAEVVRAEVTAGSWQLLAELPAVSVPRGTGLGECPRGQYICVPFIVEVPASTPPIMGEWYGWEETPQHIPTYQEQHLLPLVRSWIKENWLASR